MFKPEIHVKLVDAEVSKPEGGSESDCVVDVFFENKFLKGRHRYDLSCEQSRKDFLRLGNHLRIGKWDPLQLKEDLSRSMTRLVSVTFPPLDALDTRPYVSGSLRYKETLIMDDDPGVWFAENDQRSELDVVLLNSDGSKIVWSIFPIDDAQKEQMKRVYSGNYIIQTEPSPDVMDKYGDSAVWSMKEFIQGEFTTIEAEKGGSLTTLVLTPPEYDGDDILKGRYVVLPGLTSWKCFAEEVYDELIYEG